MKLDERIKMVKAMEYIARQVNDEEVFDLWLTLGVADGDIEYGDLSAYENLENDDAAWYADDDKIFAELMELFLDLMKSAKRSGGLYCDGVVSKKEG